MLPVIDYGSIAVVVSKVSAVGSVIEDEDNFGFEVFMTGTNEPLIIGFEDESEAEESRNDLVAIIAQYHIAKDFGPDFDFGEFLDEMEEAFDEENENVDDDEDDDSEKH